MFSSRVSFLVALSAASLVIACGSDTNDGGGGGPCDGDQAAPECGATCDDSTPCAAGFYCGTDGTCTAECSGAAEGCADNEECSADGHCVPSGSSDDGADDNAGDDSSDDGGDDSCPAVQVALTPVVPDVVLLLDQSSSMDADFPNSGDPSRWDAMNLALLGPAGNDGVLFQLQDVLNMGVTLYTSHAGGDDLPVGGCPILQNTPLAVSNAGAIKDVLDANLPDDDTPTGPSIAAVTPTFPQTDNPHVIILATDGLPDTCEDANPGNAAPPGAAITQAQANAVTETATQTAFEAGILTIPLSVAPDQGAIDHLQRVANIGAGLAPDTLPPAAAPVFQASDAEEMVDAFNTIIGGVRSCSIDLEDPVDLDRADEGTVILNGTELTYGDNADWHMVDEDTFELLGAACDTYKSNAQIDLSAEFPCGVVVDVD
ncbi:MAG TPA: hypothetical protein VKB80_01890 [Kofleriaceae bacterium]|nr:hypothetical protein [Kofleriaceae bacterium]